MLIKTDGNRKAAYDSVINLALKDTRAYCNNCGFVHPSRTHISYICCNEPQVGTNLDHAKAVIKQNKELRKIRLNEYASTQDKSLRWGVSLPKWMYSLLDEYEKRLSTQDEPGRRLFKSKEDIFWFAKNYPQFSIPERL